MWHYPPSVGTTWPRLQRSWLPAVWLFLTLGSFHGLKAGFLRYLAPRFVGVEVQEKRDAGLEHDWHEDAGVRQDYRWALPTHYPPVPLLPVPTVNIFKSSECVPMAICGQAVIGRLGNALFMLERALWLAHQRNFCFVVFTGEYARVLREFIKLPMDGVLRLHAGYEKWQKNEIKCNLTCHAHDCKTKKLIEYGTPPVNVLREVMQSLALPYAWCERFKLQEFPEDTLVMQIRGGDTVFSTSILNGWYPQPPCAYWFAVMRRGNNGTEFPRAHIITERWFWDPRPNPCIAFLQGNFTGRITVQTSSVAQDACTIMQAKSLAVSFSTFGCALARLAQNLTNIYSPFGEDGGWGNKNYGGASLGKEHWYRDDVVWEGGGMPYNQYVYTFPNFTCNWGNPRQRQAAMINYDNQLVIERRIQRYAVGLG